MAFAMSFDSLAQAAFFADPRQRPSAASGRSRRWRRAFGLGMLVADAANGALLAGSPSRSDAWRAGQPLGQRLHRADRAARRRGRALRASSAPASTQAWEQAGMWVGVALMGIPSLAFALLHAHQRWAHAQRPAAADRRSRSRPPPGRPRSAIELFITFAVISLQSFGGALAFIERTIVQREALARRAASSSACSPSARCCRGPTGMAFCGPDRRPLLRPAGALAAFAGFPVAAELSASSRIAALFLHYQHVPQVQGARCMAWARPASA